MIFFIHIWISVLIIPDNREIQYSDVLRKPWPVLYFIDFIFTFTFQGIDCVSAGRSQPVLWPMLMRAGSPYPTGQVTIISTWWRCHFNCIFFNVEDTPRLVNTVVADKNESLLLTLGHMHWVTIHGLCLWSYSEPFQLSLYLNRQNCSN